MRINLEYDVKILLDQVLGQILRPQKLAYDLQGLSTVTITSPLTNKQLQEVSLALKKYGITIIDTHSNNLVSRIKLEITTYLTQKENIEHTNISSYLSDKLGYSYGHLSTLFANSTFNSLENFVILKRVDLAKQMLKTGKYTLTEVAFTLQFSNVSHLSSQFKKVTGLTPSSFLRIINERSKLERENPML